MIAQHYPVSDTAGYIPVAFDCARCAGTGKYITHGVPSGPGGDCYRCAGKGYHTQEDRKRNYGYDTCRAVSP
jgi:hypothetical protein